MCAPGATDWVIDPQSSPRTAPLSLVSGAISSARVSGHADGGAFYTHSLPPRGRPSEYRARIADACLENTGVPLLVHVRPSSLTSPGARGRSRCLKAWHVQRRDRRSFGICR
jgi:hypothetical protein